MKKLTLPAAMFTVLFVLAAAPELSWACTCGRAFPLGSKPALTFLWGYPAAFTGKVTEITSVKGQSRVIDQQTIPGYVFNHLRVRVELKDVAHGADPGTKEIEIVTADSGSACGYPFK